MTNATKARTNLAEIRRVIDALGAERVRLSLLPTEEFRRAPVADRLRGHIEDAAALEVSARYAEEAAARELAVTNALDLIAQWRKCEVDGRRARKAGCCGR